MRIQIAGFEYLPSVSLALIVSDDDEVWIKSSVRSLLAQVYPHLELCVCDNGSARPHVREVLEDYAANDERVKIRRLPERRSRAEAYNSAFSGATGELVALLEAGDELAPEALFRVVDLLQRVRADVIYTDEDSVDVTGKRLNPVFKPYWSPDLLLSVPYAGRLCVIRRELLDASGAFREGFEGAEEHDLLLRLSEKTDSIRHLPGVLYHRRLLPGREADLDGGPSEASLRAVEEALARRGEGAAVGPDPKRGSLRVTRRVAGAPGVSVIVSAPEGEAAGLPVVGDLERKTSYPVRQVIVAGSGPGSHATGGWVNHPFPARALNLAADRADSEYLVFVNARARVQTLGWLTELLGHAQRRGVGAVGCALLDPSGGLRHGGSLVEVSRLAGSLDTPLSGDRMPLVEGAFNFFAASATCMMVRKAVFEEAGGFDDEKLPTAFYDLDLCLRLRESGLVNVYTPHASLVHGGPEPLPTEEEVAYVWRRWWERLVQLLYYRFSPLHAEHDGFDGDTLGLL